MKIKRLQLKDFMLFQNLDIPFSPHVNIISGENSTGKTALIKLLYSCMKGCSSAGVSKGDLTKEEIETMLVSKFQGVFRPDNEAIGRLVRRKRGSNRTEIRLELERESFLEVGFGNRQERHMDVIQYYMPDMKSLSPVYLPPKEIISSTENFGALYDEYHIAFEETYYDLARMLERPLRKGANTQEQNAVLKSFENIVNGSIIQKDKKFYLKVKEAGEFEMGLVSEGYRKLATIMYLILSGGLSKNSILFWDEPETNMNPKMIKPLTDAIIVLAQMGVQVFVTTHNYFVQQEFQMAAAYRNTNKNPLQYCFISLNKTENGIACETAKRLDALEHNAVMEEFDQLYDREQELLYDN